VGHLTGYLIASEVALWLAVIALAAIVVALARQIGVLHERIAPAGALMLPAKGVAVGDAAPALALVTLAGGEIAVGGARAGRSQLLFFLSPDCPVCKTLLPALRDAARAERSWLDIVLASDGEAEPHRDFVRAEGLGRFDYVVSEPLGRAFGVAKLPYGVLIGEDARIASMGLVNSREHLESLFEAKERGVTSLQAFLARRGDTGGQRKGDGR
jgi:methylamine dehydrogenase accessory protein MauD